MKKYFGLYSLIFIIIGFLIGSYYCLCIYSGILNGIRNSVNNASSIFYLISLILIIIGFIKWKDQNLFSKLLITTSIIYYVIMIIQII